MPSLFYPCFVFNDGGARAALARSPSIQSSIHNQNHLGLILILRGHVLEEVGLLFDHNCLAHGHLYPFQSVVIVCSPSSPHNVIGSSMQLIHELSIGLSKLLLAGHTKAASLIYFILINIIIILLLSLSFKFIFQILGVLG